MRVSVSVDQSGLSLLFCCLAESELAESELLLWSVAGAVSGSRPRGCGPVGSP